MPALSITGGQVLLRSGLCDATVRVEDGRIGATGSGEGGRRIDAAGLLVLPGIVDLHGDAFERQIQPRPGVDFPIRLALRDTEAQLLANGITTAMHAVTLSWEPGLRGPESWRGLMLALEAHRPDAVCDMRVHMRWEMHNLDALPMALEDVEAGRVWLLSFNDHTPAILRRLGDPATAAKYSERAGMELSAFRVLAEQAAARAPEVEAGLGQLAAAARARGLPMASHDDATPEQRARFRAVGAGICEFPMGEAVGLAAREAGDAVVMGCPNVVRGGSHLGWASAAALAERGICNVLCSDYFYPAMMPAALALARRGVLSLPEAWALLAANPARAARLDDRGVIAEGKRADLVLVDPEAQTVVATIAGGRVGWLSAEGWARVRS